MVLFILLVIVGCDCD
nr:MULTISPECIES: YjcZ family sporulation protein [Brevibacillus]